MGLWYLHDALRRKCAPLPCALSLFARAWSTRPYALRTACRTAPDIIKMQRSSRHLSDVSHYTAQHRRMQSGARHANALRIFRFARTKKRHAHIPPCVLTKKRLAHIPPCMRTKKRFARTAAPCAQSVQPSPNSGANSTSPAYAFSSAAMSPPCPYSRMPFLAGISSAVSSLPCASSPAR